jgi:hypothetical protein
MSRNGCADRRTTVSLVRIVICQHIRAGPLGLRWDSADMSAPKLTRVGKKFGVDVRGQELGTGRAAPSKAAIKSIPDKSALVSSCPAALRCCSHTPPIPTHMHPGAKGRPAAQGREDRYGAHGSCCRCWRCARLAEATCGCGCCFSTQAVHVRRRARTRNPASPHGYPGTL